MSEERLADFPDIPTAKEQGVDWVAVAWRGFAMPKGTLPEIMAPLQEKFLKIAMSVEFQSFLKKNGFVVKVRAAEEFSEFLRQQDAQWQEVVHFAGYEKGLTGNNDPGPLALPALLRIGLVVGGASEWLGGRSRRSVTSEVRDVTSSLPDKQQLHGRQFKLVIAGLIASRAGVWCSR